MWVFCQPLFRVQTLIKLIQKKILIHPCQYYTVKLCNCRHSIICPVTRLVGAAEMCQNSSGRLFHTMGPFMGTDWQPKLVRQHKMSNSPFCAEHRWAMSGKNRLLTMSKISKYDSPCVIEFIMVHSSNIHTGSPYWELVSSDHITSTEQH